MNKNVFTFVLVAYIPQIKILDITPVVEREREREEGGRDNTFHFKLLKFM